MGAGFFSLPQREDFHCACKGCRSGTAVDVGVCKTPGDSWQFGKLQDEEGEGHLQNSRILSGVLQTPKTFVVPAEAAVG